jgi:uncharacterized protein YbbK (DUF523 family)
LRLMERVLISRCLLGEPCRWDGIRLDSNLNEILKDNEIFSICPEVDAGLPCPRPKAEIAKGNGFDVLDGVSSVIDNNGQDVTASFLKGAQIGLNLCLANDIKKAILKDKSPSCGVNHIYVDGRLISGVGVTAALLARHRVEINSIKW